MTFEKTGLVNLSNTNEYTSANIFISITYFYFYLC